MGETKQTAQGKQTKQTGSGKTEQNERMSLQSEKRRELISLFGDLPQCDRSRVTAKLVDTVENDLFTLEKLTLDLNGFEPVPAYFVKPRGIKGKMPVVLFNHSHGGNYHVGKDELLSGAVYLQKTSYAEALAREGYAVLCIDAWCFGERRGRTESQIFKDMLWNGKVLWGMMAYDAMRAMDYLFTRSDIDTGRIATAGLSMGGTMAWWLSALDERVKVCVDMCSLTDFHTLSERNGFDGHSFYYYVPGLLKHFTTAGINELTVPRPHLCQTGKYDHLVPYAGIEKIDGIMKEAYKKAGAEDAWQLRVYPCGHMETAEMRAETLAFLRKWL